MGSFVSSLFEVAIFLFATAFVFFLAMMIDRMVLQQRRLGQQMVLDTNPSAPLLHRRSAPNPIFQWIQNSSSISEPEQREKLRRELALAGFEGSSAPVLYVITRFALAIGLPALFLLFEYSSPNPMGVIGLMFWSLILCGIGLVAPGAYIQRKAAARRTELEFEFPDALDLMVVCVEAGLSLDMTLVRVGQEVVETHPRISREFERCTEEIRAGRSRADALRSMADRTDVQGIKSFAALVIQSESLGSSITQTLRTYSNELRETRYIRAEEKALRIPVLMTIPLVTCILPVIVTALLLPPILDVIRTLFPALRHTAGGG